jgi:hypothetical protein
MKVVEILGGYRFPVSNEEMKIVNYLKKNKSLDFSKISDRQKQLAYDLHRRNIVKISDGGMITMNGLVPYHEIDLDGIVPKMNESILSAILK